MANVGIAPKRRGSDLLFQSANVSDEILDLICFQTFSVCRHFCFSIADDSSDGIVTLRLDVRGTKITNVVRFADGSLAFSVRAMAARAFGFVKSIAAGLPLRRQRQKPERRAEQKAQDCLSYSFCVSIHISSRSDVAQTLDARRKPFSLSRLRGVKRPA
jgi:hypothetical protein